MRATDQSFRGSGQPLFVRISRRPGTEIDPTRTLAKKALDNYLSLPILAEIQEGDAPDASNDTFIFWRNYSKNSNRAEKALAHLARIYLTPPPTSTGMFKTMEI